LATFFKSNNPLSIIFLFFYGFLLRFASFLQPKNPVVFNTDGVFYKWFVKSLEIWGVSNSFVYPFFTYLFVFVQALLLNKYIGQYRMLSRSNFLPAFSYILLTSVFPAWWQMSSALVVNTFLVWIWGTVLTLYKNSNAKQPLFNIGILLGFSSFVFTPSLYFCIVLLVWLIILRSFDLTEYLVSLLGMGLPYYFLFAILFLTDKMDIVKYLFEIQFVVPSLHQDNWIWYGLAVILIPFIISLLYFQNTISRMLIQARKNWHVLMGYLLFSLIVAGVNGSVKIEYWIITTIPFAAFHSNALISPKRKLLPNIIHILSLVYIVVINVKAVRGW
jgi:Family of unknown function (DUF6427)